MPVLVLQRVVGALLEHGVAGRLSGSSFAHLWFGVGGGIKLGVVVAEKVRVLRDFCGRGEVRRGGTGFSSVLVLVDACWTEIL